MFKKFPWKCLFHLRKVGNARKFILRSPWIRQSWAVGNDTFKLRALGSIHLNACKKSIFSEEVAFPTQNRIFIQDLKEGGRVLPISENSHSLRITCVRINPNQTDGIAKSGRDPDTRRRGVGVGWKWGGQNRGSGKLEIIVRLVGRTVTCQMKW